MVKFPFKVFQTEVEGHVFWVAKSRYLKGCVGQGDLQEDAIAELEENEKAWLETAHEMGVEIPEVPIECVAFILKKLLKNLFFRPYSL